METYKSVRSYSESLELGKLSYIFSCIKATEELVCIRIEYDFFSSCKILHLERKRFLCLKHEELDIPHTSLMRTVLPHLNVVPMLHLLRCIPFRKHSKRTTDCQYGKRVTCSSSYRDRKGCLLNHLEFVMASHAYLFERIKSNISDSLNITRIDLPLEMYIDFTWSCPSVEIQLSLGK